MNLGIVRIREGLGMFVPVPRVFGHECSKVGEDSSVKALDLAVRLRMISCCEHVLRTQVTTDGLEELRCELAAVI